LIGRTLKGIRFRERFGLQVLGLSRHGKILHRKISELPLRIGDILLIQGPRAEIATLEEDRTFRIIQTLDDRKPHYRRAPIAIAIQTALQLGLNPRTFAMMVAVAASCSYLTPLEPSCLMVYGPGGYKFLDFLKYGAVLTIIIGAIALALIPRVWPLH